MVSSHSSRASCVKLRPGSPAAAPASRRPRSRSRHWLRMRTFAVCFSLCFCSTPPLISATIATKGSPSYQKCKHTGSTRLEPIPVKPHTFLSLVFVGHTWLGVLRRRACGLRGAFSHHYDSWRGYGIFIMCFVISFFVLSPSGVYGIIRHWILWYETSFMELATTTIAYRHLGGPLSNVARIWYQRDSDIRQ
ncbi:hypothetical protein GGI35DRAFT_165382 [Trichoderma velutinum]